MLEPKEIPPAQLDLLVIAAHPDDAEISVGGVLLTAADAGLATGVLDLTRGEMGTRGSEQDRTRETELATERLGLTLRSNLGLPDGRVEVSLPARERLAHCLRSWRPRMVIAHHVRDPHPDHQACGELARQAWYLSGLKKLAAMDGGPPAARPPRLMHFLSHLAFEPTLVVDIGPVWERKCEVVRAYSSQLEPADTDDRGAHFLGGTDILARMETKARHWGESIGVQFGEPLLSSGPLACDAFGSWFGPSAG